jgi:hypothetical protein
MIQSSEKYSNGNKPYWKQVVILLLVGMVFYGGVYLFLVAKKGDYKELGSISKNSTQVSYGK